jgi:hypothetical protein
LSRASLRNFKSDRLTSPVLHNISTHCHLTLYFTFPHANLELVIV